MARSVNVYARIDPELKEQAEAVMEELGLTASSAITMLYKQMVLRNALPFEVSSPRKSPEIEGMSQDEIDARLWRSYRQTQKGETMPFDEYVEKTRGKYGL